LLWIGFEEVLGNRLLGQAAKKRGLTPEALMRAEVDDKLATPTEEEIRAFFEANAEIFSVPFEEVAPHIEREMNKQRRREQERVFVESLRSQARVEYALPIPELPRFDVPA